MLIVVGRLNGLNNILKVSFVSPNTCMEKAVSFLDWSFSQISWLSLSEGYIRIILTWVFRFFSTHPGHRPPKYRYANLLSLFLHLFFIYRHYFLFLKAYIQAGFCVRIVDEAEIIWRDLHFSKPSGQTPFQPFFVVF